MSNTMSRPVYIENVNIGAEFLEKQNILKKEYTCDDVSYTILNADKNYLCDTDQSRRIYNTVIISPDTEEIVSIGSPISTPINLFACERDILSVTEMIEGSIIYIFYDTRLMKWQMATSNAIGGKYSYYRENANTSAATFLQMMFDGFREGGATNMEELKFLELLDKKYSYGFVLQHPQNEMVQSIKEAKMYLVSVSELSHDARRNHIRYVPRSEYESWDCFANLTGGIIHFPRLYTDKESLEDYKKMYDDMQTPSDTMGICVTNTMTGERSEVINPNYKEAKDIRGNNFNLQFHYLCLMKLNKVNEFLKFFPRYRRTFFNYKDQLNRFITNLHQTYFGYYISKTIQGKIHKKYYYHISQIHKTIYIPSLEKGEKKVIKRSVVASYVESLEPGVILHMINFEKNDQNSKTEEDEVLEVV